MKWLFYHKMSLIDIYHQNLREWFFIGFLIVFLTYHWRNPSLIQQSAKTLSVDKKISKNNNCPSLSKSKGMSASGSFEISDPPGFIPPENSLKKADSTIQQGDMK